MGTFAKLKDPYEISHNAASYEGLRCLLRKYRSSEKELHVYLFENYNMLPFNLYIGPNIMGNCICIKVKQNF